MDILAVAYSMNVVPNARSLICEVVANSHLGNGAAAIGAFDRLRSSHSKELGLVPSALKRMYDDLTSKLKDLSHARRVLDAAQEDKASGRAQ